MNFCPPRSREALLAMVRSLDVVNSPRYKSGAGLTWCNRFVSDITLVMDCEVPFMLANRQCDWLAEQQGIQAGWRIILPVDVPARVEQGFPVVAAWKNPDPEAHGHIALCVPSFGSTGIHVAAAGAHNFQNAPLAQSFGPYVPSFFTHP